MSEAKYGEPWLRDGSGFRAFDGSSLGIGRMGYPSPAGEPVLDRIAACVNALAGLSDEEVEAVAAAVRRKRADDVLRENGYQ